MSFSISILPAYPLCVTVTPMDTYGHLWTRMDRCVFSFAPRVPLDLHFSSGEYQPSPLPSTSRIRPQLLPLFLNPALRQISQARVAAPNLHASDVLTQRWYRYRRRSSAQSGKNAPSPLALPTPARVHTICAPHSVRQPRPAPLGGGVPMDRKSLQA